MMSAAVAQSDNSSVNVSLPEGWSKVEGSVLRHQYLKNGASFMVKEETSLNGKPLNDAVEEAKRQISSYFKEYKLIEDVAIKVDGREARSITYDYTAAAGGMTLKMRMRTVYLMVGGKCQTLSFGATASQFGNLTADMDKIVRGIRFR